MAAALAPLVANLVHQTTTGTGTGNLTLSTVSGKQSFNTAFGNGATTDVFPYFISNEGASEYERGTGHMSDATTLVRDTVSESTNANAAVNFSAGTKDVICDIPATRQWYTQEVALASAGTTDLGTYPSACVSITGTTTITSHGSTAPTGAVRFIKFAGALTYTHNATSLIIPGEANITTAAGDCAIVRHEGSGNWRVLHYQKATGTAIVATDATLSTSDITTNDVSTSKHGFVPKAPNLTYKYLLGDGSWGLAPKLLASGSVGVGTTVSFTGLPPVEVLFIVLLSVSHDSGSNQSVGLALSSNNGSSYGTSTAITNSFSSAGTISADVLCKNFAQNGVSKRVSSLLASGVQSFTESTTTGVINAIQLAPSGGNFDAGNVYIYG